MRRKSSVVKIVPPSVLSTHATPNTRPFQISDTYMPPLIRFKNWLWLGSKPSRQINPWRRDIVLEQERSARLILEQQGAAGRRRNYRHQPLDDRLEQRIELGLLAELQRQFVEQGQCLRPIRIDRLNRLQNRRRGVDHFGNVEARIMGIDQ